MNDSTDERVVGRVLYDGDCPFCCRWVARFAPVLRRRGFVLGTLQQAGASLTELRCELPDGRCFGGADALTHLARQVRWAWPFWALTRVPGVQPLLRAGYRWVASRRCRLGACADRQPRRRRTTAFFDLSA